MQRLRECYRVPVAPGPLLYRPIAVPVGTERGGSAIRWRTARREPAVRAFGQRLLPAGNSQPPVGHDRIYAPADRDPEQSRSSWATIGSNWSWCKVTGAVGKARARCKSGEWAT